MKNPRDITIGDMEADMQPLLTQTEHLLVKLNKGDKVTSVTVSKAMGWSRRHANTILNELANGGKLNRVGKLGTAVVFERV